MSSHIASSIVRIFDFESKVIGGGLLISDNKVITCAHVVAHAYKWPNLPSVLPDKSLQLDLPLIAPENFLRAKVVFWQPSKDIAGLQIEGKLPSGTQPNNLIPIDNVWGHPFRAFGFPQGHDNGVWASGVLRDRQATGWIQIEDVKEAGFRVQQGFSGGPVWDEVINGIVGMTVAADNQPGNKTAFIIPVTVLGEVWSELREIITTSQTTVSNNLNLPKEKTTIKQGLFPELNVDAEKEEGTKTYDNPLLPFTFNIPVDASVYPPLRSSENNELKTVIKFFAEVGNFDLGILRTDRNSHRPMDASKVSTIWYSG